MYFKRVFRLFWQKNTNRWPLPQSSRGTGAEAAPPPCIRACVMGMLLRKERGELSHGSL